MTTMEIRQRLHQYIDAADDDQINATYTIVQGNTEQQRFSADDLKKIYGRRSDYLEGKTATYSVEEAHNIIRQGARKI